MNDLFLPVGALFLAMAVSALLIPWLIRIAPRIGMIDVPNLRKVHIKPIPRVGGIGIACGALIAVVPLTAHNPAMLSFVVGSLILLMFGAWDDLKEISHFPKFAGQIAAASLVIWGGDVWIHAVPFVDAALPAWLGKPLTLIALVGVINAINHADGLDGLAAGEALLSLGGMSCLAFMDGQVDFLILVAGVAGGLLGFLRYNTHPASVFMGDLGSQFLGFSIGVLAVMLTQNLHVSASKSIALLLVGLPVVDIVVVLGLRIHGGMNWFRATRNHIHHRLLQQKFEHHEAVMLIYAVQATLVAGGVLLAYEPEAMSLGLYALVCSGLFAMLLWMESAGRSHRGPQVIPTTSFLSFDAASAWVAGPLLLVRAAVTCGLVFLAWSARQSPATASLAVVAAVPLCLLVVPSVLPRLRLGLVSRLALFCTVGLLVHARYLAQSLVQSQRGVLPSEAWLEVAVLLALVLSIFWTAYQLRDEFGGTPFDFLLAVMLLGAAVFAHEVLGNDVFWGAVIEGTVLLYGCELILLRGGPWARWLHHAATLSLVLLLARLWA